MCYKTVLNLGTSFHGVLMQSRGKIDKVYYDAPKLCILSNSVTFSAGWPLLPGYNFFSATMASTSSIYRLDAVASLKFLLIKNKPRIMVKLHIVN